MKHGRNVTTIAYQKYHNMKYKKNLFFLINLHEDMHYYMNMLEMFSTEHSIKPWHQLIHHHLETNPKIILTNDPFAWSPPIPSVPVTPVNVNGKLELAFVMVTRSRENAVVVPMLT